MKTVMERFPGKFLRRFSTAVGKNHRNAIFLLAGFVAAAPLGAAAQVVITEIMYDPPGNDSGQEWIELYNAGSSAVDLTKWKFNDGGSSTNHAFNVPPKNGGIGSIVIQPGEYLLVADNATNTAAAYPSVANVIDSVMSMPDPNAGVSATVTLMDDGGTAEDTLTYTGGTDADNKGASVQRVSFPEKNVVIAAPTPGIATVSSGTNDTSNVATTTDSQTQTQSQTDTNTQTQASAQTSASLSSVSSYVPPPVAEIFVDGGDDRAVIVAADTEFDARAYDRKKNLLDSNHVRFMWNFGDGSTAEGPAVVHHFEYPGRYAVVVTIAEERSAGADHLVITAEPARLSFSALSDGGVAIQNHAGRDLDLSRWIIKSFQRAFTLPENSVVLSGETLRISQKTLGFGSEAQTELEYPNGVRAFVAGEITNAVSPVPPSSAAPSSKSPTPIVSNASRKTKHTAVARAPVNQLAISDTSSMASDTIDFQVQTTDAQDDTASATTSQVAAAGALGGRATWWLSVLGFSILAAGAIVVARRYGKGEWNIVEEGEGE